LTAAIIQVRLNSKRLPGKALLKIHKKSILENIIIRLKKSKFIKKIVVSTSNKKSDLPIVDFCKKNKILFYNGSLNDVFDRVKKTSIKFKLKYFIRICADSPLIDPKLIDTGISKFLNGKFDIVTNKFPRSFPIGQTVEVVSVGALNMIDQQILKKSQKEHITRYFYDNYENFKIHNFAFSKNKSHISMAIDNKRDLTFLRLLNKRNNDKINNLTLRQLINNYEKKNF
tara:strand:- start:411 stop:1094 length:684 start_codon:yes stop_codon:yes gene_type:complete